MQVRLNTIIELLLMLATMLLPIGVVMGLLAKSRMKAA
jgi:hypothetical protein